MELSKLCSTLSQLKGDLVSLKAGLSQQGNPHVALTLEQVTNPFLVGSTAAMNSLQNGQATKMLMELSWEQLHLGHWKDVLLEWRDLYALASLISASLVLQTKPSQQESAEARIEGPAPVEEALRLLDLGIMMGGPTFRPALHTAASDLSAQLAELQSSPNLNMDTQPPGVLTEQPSRQPPEKRARMVLSYGSEMVGKPEDRPAAEADVEVQEGWGSDCRSEDKIGGSGVSSWRAAGAVKLPPHSLHLAPDGCSQPPVVHLPDLEDFLVQFMMAPGGGQPAIVTGAMATWPALTRWQDLQYLARIAGHRTVPVEVGRHYLDQEWGQQLMTLSEFITSHVAQSKGHTGPTVAEDDAKERGYLAQHPLFDQVPALAADVLTPEYCALTEDEEKGGVQAVNAWFGPAGTVTPLHTDPHHNLLAQVVGRKYVRLYAPKHDAALYPFQEGLTTNTSQVDLDAPDYERFPLFHGLPYVDCLLEPGQMLFIPKGWWHYVRSLSISFSVSFWWR